MAEESGDGEKVKVIQDELNELEERAEALDRQRTKNISAIRYTHTSLCKFHAVIKTDWSSWLQIHGLKVSAVCFSLAVQTGKY